MRKYPQQSEQNEVRSGIWMVECGRPRRLEYACPGAQHVVQRLTSAVPKTAGMAVGLTGLGVALMLDRYGGKLWRRLAPKMLRGASHAGA